MSRNFELLAQLGNEVRLPGHKSRETVDGRVAAAKVASSDADMAGDEEMVRLVQRVFLSTNGSSHRHVVFCGVESANGSSSVCARAGRTLAANTSHAVCLVDANLRSRYLSLMFGADATPPFSSRASSAKERCEQISGNLWLGGTGLLSDERGALASLEQLRHLLAQLSGSFEYILIDAPGANVCEDAAILGQAADAAVLVIEANSTRRLVARKAMETLTAARVPVLGAVLHNRSFPIPEGLYKRL